MFNVEFLKSSPHFILLAVTKAVKLAIDPPLVKIPPPLSTGKLNINLVFALFFGLIHGLGFSNYFRMMIGKEEDKFFPLLEFALGIEASQVIIVLIILLIGAILQNIFKVSRRDWILVASSIVIGFAIPMIIERIFW